MAFSIIKANGCIIGLPHVSIYNAKGELKTCVPPGPPPAPVIWGSITGTVTNQTDLINYLDLNYYPLNSNPAGYVPDTRTLTINGTSYDLSADRSWTIPAGGTVTSVELAAGTGISLSGTNPITTFGTITVTNDAPDQVVVLTAGAGIDITGTYPSFTINNTGLVGDPTLQQVVNAGNGISNFGGTGTASIQSTNFTNNRTLYLNDNAFPTIRLVDNLNAANNLQIDVDTLVVDGVSYNWSSIVNPPSGTLVALPFTTDHITANGNPYAVGDVVYYLGDIYRCIAGNDSILPTNAAYWTSLGAGFPLVQQPSDWNSTSGNNQILNKPTIPSPQGLQDVITTDPVLTQDNDIDGGGFTQSFINNYKFGVYAEQLIELSVNDGAQSVQFNLYPQAGSTSWAYDDGVGNRTAIEMSGVKMYIQTPGYASASNGDVLTLINNANGEVEFQTPGTTTGDSLSPLLLMGG
jgi:hypothetical protein